VIFTHGTGSPQLHMVGHWASTTRIVILTCQRMCLNLGASPKTETFLWSPLTEKRRDLDGRDRRDASLRVWWTIYTWDRFASITYGRPLGINDKDCNLDMPAVMVAPNREKERFGRP
jgi:hypothetical protein